MCTQQTRKAAARLRRLCNSGAGRTPGREDTAAVNPGVGTGGRPRRKGPLQGRACLGSWTSFTSRSWLAKVSHTNVYVSGTEKRESHSASMTHFRKRDPRKAAGTRFLNDGNRDVNRVDVTCRGGSRSRRHPWGRFRVARPNPFS